MGELMTLFLSITLYVDSPLEPIQILWINLVTGALVAIPLGLEPGAGNELKQPPRDSRVGLLYPGMLMRIVLIGLLMSLPVANRIFHTRSLTPAEWVWVLLPTAVAVTIETLRKRIAPHLFAAGQWKPLRAGK